MTTTLLLYFIALCAHHHGVDPHFAQAVAIVESGNSSHTLRWGRLGRSKFYGPMGIHRCFLKKWPIDQPLVNVWVGVKALKGKDWRRVLRRYYGKKPPQSYVRAVKRKWVALRAKRPQHPSGVP